MKPQCIVLDEPTAMLDPSGRQEVMKTILRLNKEGITVLLITHYMDEAVQAQRVVVMDSGEIKMDSTPEDVFSHVSEIKSLGLDVPQASELAFRLKERGIDVPLCVLDSDSCVEMIESLLKKH